MDFGGPLFYEPLNRERITTRYCNHPAFLRAAAGGACPHLEVGHIQCSPPSALRASAPLLRVLGAPRLRARERGTPHHLLAPEKSTN